ncbi:MAG TPA: hypothetical protein VGQ58_07640 [Candidatus Limnocylindrales bacterium]|jgi:hypothetical protein|nr:hypothetical protein [Candidatus Limnocylindrales bacterium]
MRWAAVVLAIAAAAACSPSSSPSASDDDFAVIPGLGATRIDVPRPTGPAPATCEPVAAGPTGGQSIQQRVAGLRGIGFFADRAGTDAEIAGHIKKQIEADFGAPPAATDPFIDLLVAATDVSRVWWGDLEADVDEANAVYASVLEEWGAISSGAFAPTGIEETWDSPTGPVSISLTTGDRSLELQPEYLEDWIDPRILTPVNDVIAASGRQFELYRAFDQTLFLVALTPGEKRALEKDRGWCFEWPSSG